MRIKEISSSSNALFREIESLMSSRGIKKTGLCLISGKKILPEILARKVYLDDSSDQPFGDGNDESSSSKLQGSLLFSTSSYDLAEELAEKFSIERGIMMSPELFESLDDSGTKHPLYVEQSPKLKDFEKEMEGLNVFLALSDPSNLGAALRTLKAFQATQVILLKESAHPFLPKVTKAASGHNFGLNLTNGPSISDLPSLSDQLNLFYLDMDGEDLSKFKWPSKVSLLLGEEGKGVPTSLLNSAKGLKIQIDPNVESLSAPIALSIATWSYQTQNS
ncbi:MAG: RNA methyltransferase [Bdellovibrionales bacterium]|nr:RNA methyltransferase [Bdellovibrionales bacterium]